MIIPKSMFLVIGSVESLINSFQISGLSSTSPIVTSLTENIVYIINQNNIIFKQKLSFMFFFNYAYSIKLRFV